MDVACATERFGTEYGGWDVASGTLDAQSIVYSVGVGEDASFDLGLIEKYGLVVHAFDPTPRSIAWVRQQGLPAQFVLHEFGIAGVDGDLAFHPPENPEHVSHTLLDRPATRAGAIRAPVKRLGTAMKELGHNRLDLLKMDIEGAEYDVLDDMRGAGIRPRQILVEFHHRFDGIGTGRTIAAIASLRSLGYRLFAVSKSNQEFCFILA